MLFILYIHNITLWVPRTESYSNLSLEVQVPTSGPKLVILTGRNKQLRCRFSLSKQLHLVIWPWFQSVILELQLLIEIDKHELTAMLVNCPSQVGVNTECCNAHCSSDVGKNHAPELRGNSRRSAKSAQWFITKQVYTLLYERSFAGISERVC